MSNTYSHMPKHSKKIQKNEKQSNNLKDLRHSLAHLLAAAVLELWPDTKRTIGPATDTGFYYDFDFKTPIGENDLPTIEAKMHDILATWSTFEAREVTHTQAKKHFKENPYKLELIEEIKKNSEKITFYSSGNYTDLCKGGHIINAKAINTKAFTLTHLAGAYWRGDEKNKMLTRIYGLAFVAPKELKAYMTKMQLARERDHRKVGKELGLFVFSETVGKGLPLWSAKGATIRRVLERFVVDEEIKRGYSHVYTPDIASIDLYKKSGHYPYYKDSMYAPIVIDDEQFMLRPMTCPHHFELYLSEPRSYRDLPMRIAEVAKLYRHEQSGELSGLIRARSFSLADAHIICTDAQQAQSEVENALELIEFMAEKLGFKMGEHFWYRLSLGDCSDDKKFFKDDKKWKASEEILRKALNTRNCEFDEAKGEAAFYGPKIDIQMRNVNGKEDTAFTVQYDFVMPERFGLNYRDKDGIEKQAVVVHRSSIGAIERSIAFIIEHYGGAFPLWLSPEQVRVLPISEHHAEYAKVVVKKLLDAGYRVAIDSTDESLGRRIRNTKIAKIFYFLVIGDQEMQDNKVMLESRDNGNQGTMTIDDLLARLKTEIAEFM